MYTLDDQRKHQLTLLKKIAAGATIISRPDDVILIDELLRQGHVMALESEALGERHFLDVQIMPLGEDHLCCLLTETFEDDQSSSPVDHASKK